MEYGAGGDGALQTAWGYASLQTARCSSAVTQQAGFRLHRPADASHMSLAVSMVTAKDSAVGPTRLAVYISYVFRLFICHFCGNCRWPLNSVPFCAAEPEMRVSGRRKHAEQRSTGSLVRRSGRPTGATTAVAQVAS